jgi:GGDEF domain-containing protein
MPLFTAFGRRRPAPGGTSPGAPHGSTGVGTAAQDLPEQVRQLLPARFEAVGEALVSARDTRPACSVVGRDAALDGAALGEALDGLRATFDLVLGVEPDFASVESLSLAWSEATLEFLHQLSCEDPLTGLASLAHVRTRLDEVYREAEHVGLRVGGTHALVVVDMWSSPGANGPAHRFSRALHLVRVTEAVRMVFAGGETVGRVGADRAVVVVRRTPELGDLVAALRELLGDLDLGDTVVRVWIEGLPADNAIAALLLDDLARGH